MKYKLKTVTITSNETVSDYIASSPSTAVSFLRAVFAELDADREHFVLVTLNSKAKIAGVKVLTSGTATATIVSPLDVFRTALLLGGTSVIVAHNHPSGNPDPSQEDTSLTKRLRSAGDDIGLPLADHIILGVDEYFSFRKTMKW